MTPTPSQRAKGSGSPTSRISPSPAACSPASTAVASPRPRARGLHRWGDRAAGSLTDTNFDIVESLDAWAKDRGHTVLELAIVWLIAKPVIASVIAGATKPEQVSANAAAAGWELSASDVAEIEGIVEKAGG